MKRKFNELNFIEAFQASDKVMANLNLISEYFDNQKMPRFEGMVQGIFTDHLIMHNLLDEIHEALKANKKGSNRNGNHLW